MKWIFKNKKVPTLPSLEDILVETPAVSEYMDASRLPEAFKQAAIDTLPVIDVSGKIIGIVSEFDLAQLLPEWSFEEESYRYSIPVKDIMTKIVWTETKDTDIKELLARIHTLHTRVIPIVDNNGTYTGKSITRSAVIYYLAGLIKPRSIGGLATPLGVYMTDGRNSSGPGNPGLILTGVAFGVIVFFIQEILAIINTFIKFPSIIQQFIELALFILILRLTPLVKYHAAEHETIHAIEKGLPLSIGTVRMQPRPHKRCGTNIMVLLAGIMLLINTSFTIFPNNTLSAFLFVTVGYLFLISNWRKIGMWIQEYLTTVEAEDKHIISAIKAGEDLLKKHKEDTNPRAPGFLDKIWSMGLVQILISFIFTLSILSNFSPHLW